jgi:uroporphyrinogen-III synthase
MRLLVTRPEPDGERTAAELRARGHDVLLAPMLRVESLSTAELGAGPWAAILLTSANGARAIVAHRRVGELKQLPVLAVGDATAAAARDAGFAQVASAGGDGADLVRLVMQQVPAVGAPLLYLCGEERARDLAGELGERGFKVETAAVYRTVKAEAFPDGVRAALSAGQVDGVLHFSRRSVEGYLQCTRNLPGALEPAHFCLSERAAEPLRAAGAKAVRVPERPDERSLLALVTSQP